MMARRRFSPRAPVPACEPPVPMYKRTTVRDVARLAGVHLSTAARALKDDPRISEPTRLAVRAAAEQLGYVPDPMMAAFAAYRQVVRPPEFRGTLAWITNFPQKDGWRGGGVDLYFDGARERAAQLGYNVQEFWLRAAGMSAKRASQILTAQGVSGLLISPQPRGRGHLSLVWENFSAVAFGYSMVRPRINLVTAQQFRAVTTIVRRLRSLGYRKIGFYALHHMDERTDRLWSAAFLSQLRTLSESRAIPLCLPRAGGEDPFWTWYERWTPEAIVTTEHGVLRWLTKRGLRVPRDVGVAVVNLQGQENQYSGIDERSGIIGRVAVEMLVNMIQRGERGIPDAPLRTMVEGVWVPGSTLQPQAVR